MSTTRPTLMVTVVMALLAGVTVSVAAQTESDPAVPTFFTYTIGEPAEFTDGEYTTIDDVTTEIQGVTMDGVPVDASDPRASGVMTTRGSGHAFESDDTAASGPAAGSLRVRTTRLR